MAEDRARGDEAGTGEVREYLRPDVDAGDGLPGIEASIPSLGDVPSLDDVMHRAKDEAIDYVKRQFRSSKVEALPPPEIDLPLDEEEVTMSYRQTAQDDPPPPDPNG
jgi:hypothetical protein